MNTSSEPLVLAVYYEKKVYNIKIRFIEETNKYALGTGMRSNDVSVQSSKISLPFSDSNSSFLKKKQTLLFQMFDSVAEMIRFHSIFPIVLVSGRYIPGSRFPESCMLKCPVTRRDVDLLLQ